MVVQLFDSGLTFKPIEFEGLVKMANSPQLELQPFDFMDHAANWFKET